MIYKLEMHTLTNTCFALLQNLYCFPHTLNIFVMLICHPHEKKCYLYHIISSELEIPFEEKICYGFFEWRGLCITNNLQHTPMSCTS